MRPGGQHGRQAALLALLAAALLAFAPAQAHSGAADRPHGATSAPTPFSPGWSIQPDPTGPPLIGKRPLESAPANSGAEDGWRSALPDLGVATGSQAIDAGRRLIRDPRALPHPGRDPPLL